MKESEKMKLRYQFEIVDIAGEVCAVPVGENSEQLHGVLQLNDVGAKMLQYIAESETPEEVHAKLCADYPEDDKSDIGQKLCDFLNQLLKEKLLIP